MTDVSTREEPKSSRLMIDADVHPSIDNLHDLIPYMDKSLQKRMRLGEYKFTSGGYCAGEFTIPIQRYENIGPLRGFRLDAIPPSGKTPASDWEYLVKDCLERSNATYAILNAGEGTMAAHYDVDLAADYNSAYNDWLYHEWVKKDSRFRMTLNATPMDPVRTVQEIERVGKRPEVVGINLQCTNIPLGKRHYYPIYEISEAYGLPIVLHPDAEGAGEYSPAQAVGPASTYMEWHSSLALVAIRQVMSLACEGVFTRFPKLKFVFLEYGFSWIPSVMWRLDKNWKALREEIPWVKELPSELIRRNVLLGTQPSEEPFHPKDLLSVIEMGKMEDMLLFATDYPHWDGDPSAVAFRMFPQELRHKVFYENARRTFNL